MEAETVIAAVGVWNSDDTIFTGTVTTQDRKQHTGQFTESDFLDWNGNWEPNEEI